MSRQRQRLHRALIVIALLAVVPGGLYAAYAVARSPLAGASSHDFGFIPVELGGTSVAHTFRLTNRTGRTIEIVDVKPSCGCLRPPPQLSARTVEPGAELEVETTFNVGGSGIKTATIALIMKDRGAKTLSVRGHGRKTQQLALSRILDNPLARLAELPTFVVEAEIWEDDGDDPQLTLRAPAGVEAHLAEWAQRLPADSKRGRPARWRAKIRVDELPEDLPEDAAIVVELNPDQTISLPLNTRVPDGIPLLPPGAPSTSEGDD